MPKKHFRTLLVVMLALCLAVSAFAMAACGEKDPETLTYTVTVKTDESTPASGVKVTPKKGSAAFESQTTGADGKVTFELAPDTYEVSLSNLPDHYEVPATASLSLTKDNKDLVVTLAPKSAYQVSLVTADGKPFTASGVQIIVCTIPADSSVGNCLEPVALGEGGVTYLEVDKDNYHVKVDKLPAGYTYEQDVNGYYTGATFSATDTTMSITIYEVPELTAKAAMTEKEKTDFAANAYGFNTAAEAHYFEKELKSKEVAYFSVTAPITGKYSLISAGVGNYYSLGTSFKKAADDDTFMSQYAILSAGNTYYFAVINVAGEAGTAKFAVSMATSSYIVYTGVGGTFNVTVGSADAQAIIEYAPSVSGLYTVTAQGTTKAVVSAVVYEPSESIEEAYAETDYVAGSSANALLTDKSVAENGKIYFTVAAKATTYPATVSVKLEKTGEAADAYSYAEVKETLTKQTKEAGTELFGIPLDGTAQLVYDSEAKVYKYNNKVVWVLITEPIDSSRFDSGAALAYMELIDTRLATYELADPDDANGTINYTKFLRGFDVDEYTFGKVGLAMPDEENITVEVYYAKYVNEDGAYPLTQELKDFLEAFYEANSEAFEWQIPLDADLESAWMFPLYYYDAELVADAIVGEYKFVKYVEYEETVEVGGTKEGWNDDGQPIDVPVTDEEFKLVIDKKGTFTISRFEYDDYTVYTGGTWSKDGETYTFTETQAINWMLMADRELTVEISGNQITLSNSADEVLWIFTRTEA